MGRPIVFSFPACATTAICATQVLGAAGSLTINGSLLDLPATMCGVNRVVLPGIQRVLTISATSDISAANYTITGKDLTGATVTATGSGPNATTATTSVEFHEIDSVSFDAAISTPVVIGTGSSGKTNWAIIDRFIAPVSLDIAVAVTATTIVNAVQYTPDDVQTATGPTTFPVTGATGAFANADASLSVPARAVRGSISGVTATGSTTLTINQAGPN